jgi:pilus assembly protein Flp/PilA
MAPLPKVGLRRAQPGPSRWRHSSCCRKALLLLFGRKWRNYGENLAKSWGLPVRARAVRNYLSGETGASAAEYALLLAILGGAVAVAAASLGNATSGGIGSAANVIASISDSDPAACDGPGMGKCKGKGKGLGTAPGLNP